MEPNTLIFALNDFKETFANFLQSILIIDTIFIIKEYIFYN